MQETRREMYHLIWAFCADFAWNLIVRCPKSNCLCSSQNVLCCDKFHCRYIIDSDDDDFANVFSFTAKGLKVYNAMPFEGTLICIIIYLEYSKSKRTFGLMTVGLCRHTAFNVWIDTNEKSIYKLPCACVTFRQKFKSVDIFNWHFGLRASFESVILRRQYPI